MKFFIDTANLHDIKSAQELGILNGVTTNPSLMAKEGIKGKKNILKHYKDICDIVDGDVSAEVISTDYEGMIKEGQELAMLDPQIVIKIPMIEEGIKAIRYFSDKGIKTNCTLIFSVGQALIAAQAGATYVSPFIGRLDDSGEDGIQIVADIVDMFEIQKYNTQVLAASIRNKKHIEDCAMIGADVVTAPLDAIRGLIPHTLTETGLKQFLADHSANNS
ncbi:MAG: fructose-6-phosphate aldolase [Flavobacteriales bacterium]|nr:fructose-6-phosphate aldolase [Flavobacteriales bacterium]|tara:strand:+ start:73 stop:729 length:657 start_codon:yes stop_codon:yes gene_type:complete